MKGAKAPGCCCMSLACIKSHDSKDTNKTAGSAGCSESQIRPRKRAAKGRNQIEVRTAVDVTF